MATSRQYISSKGFINEVSPVKQFVSSMSFINSTATSGGGGGTLKTVNGLAIASVKTIDDLAIASVKTMDGLAL